MGSYSICLADKVFAIKVLAQGKVVTEPRILPGFSLEGDKPQGPHHLLEGTDLLNLNQICVFETWAIGLGEIV